MTKLIERNPIESKGLVVLDMPSYKESITGKALFDNRALRTAFYDVGINPDTLNYVYAVPVLVEGGKPTLKVMKEYRDYVEDYIAKCKPEWILCCGDTALYTVTGKRGIMKLRGSIMDNVVVTLHPNLTESQVHTKSIFRSDLQVFASKLMNEEADYSDFEWFRHKKDMVDLHKFDKCDSIAYDIETTGLDPRADSITMVGICGKLNGKYYAVIGTEPDEKKDIVNFLSSFKGSLVAHNCKFDNSFIFHHYRVELNTKIDTMLEAYAINETTPHSLKYLAKTECGADAYESGIDFSGDITKLSEYCSKDCYYTLKLKEKFRDKLLADPEAKGVYLNLLMPGLRILEKVERRGVYMDRAKLEEAKTKSTEGKDFMKAELDKLLPAGFTDVNYNSPVQIKKILYNGFKLKPFKDSFTKKEDDSTGSAILKKYAREGNEFCSTLLEYRRYSKMLSGFVEPWLELTEHYDRIYPQYNIAKTTTGRLSAQNPNLQQVSRDKSIRNIISAPEGYKFIEADYSQIELRIAAWIGHIESMKKLYKSGADIHTHTAKMVAAIKGVDFNKLTKAEQKEYRTKAKAVNFGFLYGMNAFGFIDYADAGYDVVLSESDAKKYRASYFALYHELQGWHERMRLTARRDRKVTSPFGRVRHLYNIDSRDNYEKGKAERVAINSPVQSTASDLTIMSMIELEQVFQGTMCSIVGQCHDAIFFECKEEYVDDACRLIQKVMENPQTHKFGVEIDVPIEVEIKVGKCWGGGDVWENKK